MSEWLPLAVVSVAGAVLLIRTAWAFWPHQANPDSDPVPDDDRA
jgi:hypothetical protein